MRKVCPRFRPSLGCRLSDFFEIWNLSSSQLYLTFLFSGDSCELTPSSRKSSTKTPIVYRERFPESWGYLTPCCKITVLLLWLVLQKRDSSNELFTIMVCMFNLMGHAMLSLFACFFGYSTKVLGFACWMEIFSNRRKC